MAKTNKNRSAATPGISKNETPATAVEESKNTFEYTGHRGTIKIGPHVYKDPHLWDDARIMIEVQRNIRLAKYFKKE